MTKINALRRFLLPCFSPSSSPSPSPAATKTRLSTSLRDDITDSPAPKSQSESDSDIPDPNSPSFVSIAPPRPSRTIVMGTIFGHRGGTHVWFSVQPDRFSTRPALLLQLPISTSLLVKEMQCGLVRIALESETRPGSNLRSCPLRSIPTWNTCCNGRKLGFAVRKRSTEAVRIMLRIIRGVTVGAGVIPGSGIGSGPDEGDIMYMRANYECIVGGPDSESFHLVSPDQCPGQELSIFLLRSR